MADVLRPTRRGPLLASCLPPHDHYAFCDFKLPEDVRLDDLVGRLTLSELVGQLYMDANLAYGNTTVFNSSHGDLRSTSIDRLGVAQFTYMGQGSIYRGASNGCDLNCCSGGKPPCIVDKPHATVFPQGTGFAASFDTELVFKSGVAISDESRAMQHRVPNRTVDYRSGASSVINIARDPRWGRVAETYGECPSLTAALAIAFNKGLLGFASATSTKAPKVLKTLPVIRHLGAYAGPESIRFSFDALVTEPDMALTYLPAWRKMVAAGALSGAMSAISALNGVPGIAHASLLTETLKGRWAFDGYVISDCDTFPGLISQWHLSASPEQAAALSLRAGGDINCGPGYASLYNATARMGLLQRSEVAAAARRALRMRMRVGDLQPPHTDPWRGAADLSVVASKEHGQLVDELVAGGTVVLHHAPGTLPLVGHLRAIALIGPSADDPSIQAHTYHGTPSKWTTLREALDEELAAAARVRHNRRAARHAARHGAGGDARGDARGDPGGDPGGDPDDEEQKAEVLYARGCNIDDKNTSGFAAAVAIALRADAIVYAGGLYAKIEEEDIDRMDSSDHPNGLGLPGVQLPLLMKLRAIATARGIPLVVLLVSGGPLATPELVPPSADAADALLWTSYFGQSARPLARILLGTALPSGRLPFTVPYDSGSLPPIDNYAMNAPPGRTYRYLNTSLAPPLFPFGHGLHLGPRWNISELRSSASEMTLAELRTAATHPCSSASGTAVTIHLTLTRPSGSGSMPQNASHSLLLFAALAQTAGERSPFPRQQLMDFAKPVLQPGASARVTLRVCARELLEEGLGVESQPLPNALDLWVGDASMRDASASVSLDVGTMSRGDVQQGPA